MKQITFVAWKCIKNPKAGGAEVVHQEISRRLIDDGYRVTHLVPGFAGSLKYEQIDGVEIYRVGSSLLDFYKIPFVYLKRFKQSTDVLIDVFNCFGSFTSFFAKKGTSKIFFIHHIQGRIWHYQTVFPFVKPFNIVGKLVEALQLKLYAHTFKGSVLTVSNSTKNELLRHGFSSSRTSVIHEGSDIHPAGTIETDGKYSVFTVLFVGRLENMKRPIHAVKAFIEFSSQFPDSQMLIAGSGPQGAMLEAYIRLRKVKNIKLMGRVSNGVKQELMRKSHVLVVTSVKEGWGLVVTEANSQGTPAVTYNVSGLRDSNRMGLIVDETPTAVAQALGSLYQDIEMHNALSQRSLEFSRQFTYDRSYSDLLNYIESDV